MASDRRLAPTYPANLIRNRAPALVERAMNYPDDDEEQQMGIAIRHAAIEQEGRTFLAERTRRAGVEFVEDGLDEVRGLARNAIALQEEFSGDGDIEACVRDFALDAVLFGTDTLKRQASAHVRDLGSALDRDIRPKQRPPVIVQGGPKLAPAPLFTTRQKYVIVKE